MGHQEGGEHEGDRGGEEWTCMLLPSAPGDAIGWAAMVLLLVVVSGGGLARCG